MAEAPERGSLVVVGTGITAAAHVTTEALASMQRADKLFYLVTDPVTDAWMRQLNGSAETLENCYAEGKSRFKSYEEMTARILAAVRSGLQVCAAFYGHPGVFVNASHAAIRRARQEGFSARMLPGISAEDCLFADLGLNPGDRGCQSFEASDFVGYRRRFDPTSPLILWQVGVLGERSVRKGKPCRPERLRILASVLRKHYASRHPVVLYEAAQLPTCDPVTRRIPLTRLATESILPMTTIYVPPKQARAVDARVKRWFAE